MPDLGIWNERASDPDWIVRLRAALDKAGHEHVTIVASDTSFDVCDGCAKKTRRVGPAHGIFPNLFLRELFIFRKLLADVAGCAGPESTAG